MSIEATNEVAVAVPDLVRSFAHAPETLGHPWAVVVGGVVMAGYAVYDWRSYNPEKELGLAHEASNPGLVRHSVKEVETGEDKTSFIYDKFYRVGRPIMVGLGALGIVTAAAADVGYSSREAIGGANTVIVLQTSNSTVKTHDMPNHQSRFEAAKDAIATSGYTENMSVWQFGNDNNPSIALQKFNESYFNAHVTTSAVDINGANLVDAMSKAAGTLPNHQGTEIVITDGRLEDQQSSITQQITNQNNEGIKTKVIVIGTKNGSYQDNLGAQPTPAAPQPGIFGGVNKLEVTDATDQAEVQNVIRQQVLSADSAPANKPSVWPYIPGVALALFGFLGIRKQHRKKVI